jgi:hypothetical protein
MTEVKQPITAPHEDFEFGVESLNKTTVFSGDEIIENFIPETV